MGAGKSFWGKRLAQHFDIPFIDLDAYIEQHEQQTIATLFATEGEATFRQKENKYLHKVCDTYTTCILATGGGTPCYHDAMPYLNQQGITVYLRTPIAVLADRLSRDSTQRPKLAHATAQSLSTEIKILLDGREKYYTQSQHQIDMNQDDDATFATLIAMYEQTRFTSR